MKILTSNDISEKIWKNYVWNMALHETALLAKEHTAPSLF